MLYNTNREKITRISQQIDDYINCVGKARIAVYQCPGLNQRRDFSLFLNALMMNLRRAELRPVYSWSYDRNTDTYVLILIVNGFWRNDMDDVTEAVNRLWNCNREGFIRKAADMAVNAETLGQDKMTLWNVLQQLDCFSEPTGRINPYHQRQFACCRVY